MSQRAKLTLNVILYEGADRIRGKWEMRGGRGLGVGKGRGEKNWGEGEGGKRRFFSREPRRSKKGGGRQGAGGGNLSIPPIDMT